MVNAKLVGREGFGNSLRWLKALVYLMIGFMLLIPLHNARADMGPKPTMEFIFVYEVDPPLTIVEGTLWECEDEVCTHPEPLEELGPQGFHCASDHCSSMAYGYSDYHRLMIHFSDGKVRESNIFGNRFFAATYQVTVREDDLMVEEDLWRSNSAFAGIFSFLFWLCGLPVLLLTSLSVLVWLGKRASEKQMAFSNNRGPYLLAWIVSVITILVGSLVSLTFPLTILIEGVLSLIYAKLRRRSMTTILTLVILVNSITQPLLLLAYSIADANSFSKALIYLLVLEILIWLGEAIMLYPPLRKEIAFKEILGVSFLLNSISFLVGLFLRI